VPLSAKAWFKISLDAEAAACEALSPEEQRQQGQAALGALLAAASLGDLRAIFKIGIYYKHGEFGILPARTDLAEHWLHLAAQRGSREAVFALGILFMETGRKEKGRRWLRRALALGEGGAACHLGKDAEVASPAKALRLYLKGVALREPFAAVCAGTLLEARGTRRSLMEAAKLYQKAARRQFPDAAADVERVLRKIEAMTLK